MTERVFARPTLGDAWQWRLTDSNGDWSGAFSSGDNEALHEALLGSVAQVCIMLRGQTVVATHAEISLKDKRHLEKLLPFELEEQLIDNIEDLHFAPGEMLDDNVPVIYGRHESVSTPIADLVDVGCNVSDVLPDYLLLQRPEVGATLLLDDGVVYVRLSKTEGFSVDEELAELVINKITHEYDESATIQLVAADNDEVKKLQHWLPQAWNMENGPRLQAIRGEYWDWIDTGIEAAEFNMRRGKYAKRLPVDRWMGIWKMPALFIAGAFVLSLVVNIGAYMSAKSEDKELRTQINKVYIDAVPNGRSRDPERALKSLANSSTTSNDGPTNFLFLLSRVADQVAKRPKIKMKQFSYNGKARHLQLTLEVDNIGELTTLRQDLEKVGVKGDPPRTTQLGEIYQARLKVTEIE